MQLPEPSAWVVPRPPPSQKEIEQHRRLQATVKQFVTPHLKKGGQVSCSLPEPFRDSHGQQSTRVRVSLNGNTVPTTSAFVAALERVGFGLFSGSTSIFTNSLDVRRLTPLPSDQRVPLLGFRLFALLALALAAVAAAAWRASPVAFLLGGLVCVAAARIAAYVASGSQSPPRAARLVSNALYLASAPLIGLAIATYYSIFYGVPVLELVLSSRTLHAVVSTASFAVIGRAGWSLVQWARRRIQFSRAAKSF